MFPHYCSLITYTAVALTAAKFKHHNLCDFEFSAVTFSVSLELSESDNLSKIQQGSKMFSTFTSYKRPIHDGKISLETHSENTRKAYRRKEPSTSK